MTECTNCGADNAKFTTRLCPDCALERDAADQDKRDVRADLEAGWLDSINR